ncbi:MAG: hypothetical protein CMJ18_08575 [Phycisphaeraceae bacterium]|nr:hypothetical protein [Phycisphaeraceae bacterium]
MTREHEPDSENCEDEESRGFGALHHAFGADDATRRDSGSVGDAELPHGLPRADRAAARYELREEIGRGGMGRVVRGRDVDLMRDVAVKILDQRLAGNPDIARRLVEEAQIAGQLQHPGIVPVYEVGMLEDGRPFFAMKLVQGRTLKELLLARRDEADDRRRFLGIFEQICQAIAYAHDHGVLHRDLKPSNIMVGAFGEVQVMDWGVAKVVGGPDPHAEGVQTARSSDPAGASMSGSVIGTPAWMSPEQARGEIERQDARTDVFGLGAILCQILTGRAPYVASTQAAVHELAAAGDLEAAHACIRSAEADATVEELCVRCLSADQDDRPAHAGEVAFAITAHLVETEERGRRAELAAATAEARVRSERKARRVTIGAAALVVTALAFVVLLLVQKSAQRARSAEASRRAESAIGKAQQAAQRGELASTPEPKHWAAAVAAARRAVDLASAADADPQVLDKAQRLLLEYTEVEKTARAAAATLRKDAAMTRGLERIAELLTTTATRAQRDPRYAEAFRGYGIDVLALGDAEVADAIRKSAIASRLIQALDGWAYARRTGEIDGWRRLARIAARADDDVSRNRVRKAWVADDRATLAAEANASDVAERSARDLELLAVALLGVGEHATATRVLRVAHQAWPRDFGVLLLLGLQLLDEGESASPAELVRFFSEAIALRPKGWTGWLHLGWALHRVGDDDAALIAYRKAHDLGPDFFESQHSLSMHLARLGRYEEAMELARGLTEADPDNADAWYQVGLLELNLNVLDKAERAFIKAARLRRSWPQARVQLAVVRSRQKRPQDALTILRKVLAENPNNETALHNMIIDLYTVGRSQDALEACRRLIKVNPEHGRAAGFLGLMLLTQGDLTEAEIWIRRQLARRSEAPGWTLLGRCLFLQGKGPESRAAYEQAWLRTEEGSSARHAAQRGLKDARRLEEARRRLGRDASVESVLKDEPDPRATARLANGLGWRRLAAGLWRHVAEAKGATADDRIAAARAVVAWIASPDGGPPEEERDAWSRYARGLVDARLTTVRLSDPTADAGRYADLDVMLHGPGLAPARGSSFAVSPDERTAWLELFRATRRAADRARSPR